MDRRVAWGGANARMALVGNPSDTAGGAVMAVSIEDFTATAIVGGEGPGDAPELVRAAVRAFPGPASEDLLVTCRTSIPRQVGLGGSSAIVIATMRALASHHETPLEPDTLAAAAHSAERDLLGIPCGPQDRYAQAHEGLVLMDFADGARTERLDTALLPPLFLAYIVEGAESSAATHSELGRRAEDAQVATAMADLGELAREAGRRLAAGESGALGPLMDASFDLRVGMLELDADHLQMIATARAHGAAANYTGSGGAITGTVPEGNAWPSLRAELEEQGCRVLRPALP